MSYRRKTTPVEAWQYKGQPKAEWPKFVSEYETYTQMGAAKCSTNNMGTMFVPQPGAQSALTIGSGDWIVLENSKLMAFKGAEFAALFEEAPEEAQA